MTKTYRVGLALGGVPEHPHFVYEDIQDIEAESSQEAERIYNLKNNCEYWYAEALGVKEDK